MRILAIRGSNLASLSGDFAIDFEAEPLASSGIFAITGPTGAGKSTLLDAVCLALFAEIPRLRAAPDRSQVGASGDADDTLSAKDARSILRHGAGQGHAEIDFQMPGGAKYRATWSVRRARSKADGKLQNYDHAFERLDTGERMGGTRRETKTAISAVIGLSAEQFTRAVLLAQGDFEAFIRADANERAILLERLTGSDIYTRLGQKAFEKARSLKEGLDAIRARIAAQEGLDDEARAEAEASLALAEQAYEDAQARIAALKGEEQRQQRGTELAAEIEREGARLKAAQEAREAAQERREALVRNKAAFRLAPLLSGRQRAEQALSAAGQSLAGAREAYARAKQGAQTCTSRVGTAERALQQREADAKALAPDIEKARTLDQQLSDALANLEAAGHGAVTKATAAAETDEIAKHAEAAVAAAGQRRQAAQDWCAANSELRALADRESEVAELLASHAATRARHREHSGRRSELAEGERTAIARHNEAVEVAAVARKDFQLRKDQLDQALAVTPAEGVLERLSHQIEQIGSAEKQALQAAEAWRDCQRGEGAIETARQRHTALSAEMAELDHSIREDEAGLPGLTARLASARDVYARATAASEQAAKVMRAALVDGEPCPVCGATQHAVSALDALLGENLEQSHHDLADLDSALSETRTRHQVSLHRREHLAKDIAQAEQAQADLTARQQSLIETRDARQDALLETVRALGLDTALEASGEADTRPAIDRLLAEARKAAETGQKAVLDARSATEAARRGEEQARLAHEAAREALDKATESLRHHAQALKETDAEIARLSETTEQQAKALDRLLSPVTDWQALPDAESWLHDKAGQWRCHDAELRQATDALPALDLERQNCTRARDVAAEASRIAEEARSKAATLAASVHESRSALLGGESVRAVEERHTVALAEARAAQDAARTAREEAGKVLASAGTALTGAEAGEAQAAEKLETARAVLDEALQSSGIAEADVARAAAAGQSTLDAETSALAALDTAVREAEAVLAKCRADLARHERQQEGREAPSPEALTEALASSGILLDEATRSRDAARVKILQDDQVRERTAALRAELAAASERADVWLRLNDLIGDREGRTMRRFAQGLTLDRLLEHANARLADLKPRYALERGQGGEMLIQVIDNDMGGQVRGLHNLSGGERFLVSLALALGLAEMSTARGVKIESLFIDEGFGALDPASLGQALGLLEHLQASGRRVGLISHVEELKERVPVKIEVTPSGRGTSTIAVVEG